MKDLECSDDAFQKNSFSKGESVPILCLHRLCKIHEWLYFLKWASAFLEKKKKWTVIISEEGGRNLQVGTQTKLEDSWSLEEKL